VSILRNKRDDWEPAFGEEDFLVITARDSDKPVGLHFLCPGCKRLIGISIGEESPKWTINFETLTATPSILHTKPHGCGWHGYLTNGELTGQIE
jgi:hypothetical protein